MSRGDALYQSYKNYPAEDLPRRTYQEVFFKPAAKSSCGYMDTAAAELSYILFVSLQLLTSSMMACRFQSLGHRYTLTSICLFAYT